MCLVVWCVCAVCFLCVLVCVDVWVCIECVMQCVVVVVTSMAVPQNKTPSVIVRELLRKGSISITVPINSKNKPVSNHEDYVFFIFRKQKICICNHFRHGGTSSLSSLSSASCHRNGLEDVILSLCRQSRTLQVVAIVVGRPSGNSHSGPAYVLVTVPSSLTYSSPTVPFYVWPFLLRC